ncbi:hypothetical protein HDV62DRAFT_375185 [Trichoderma sp. SZMC 28011]
MDSKYESILLSKPFTFIVGPHKKQYMIHEATVSRLSKTLDSLLNGGMRESDERCVFWEDTDEKTFIRFGEWAYTGDYKPEEPEILLDSSQIAYPDDDLPKLIVRAEETAKSLALFKDESGDNGNQGHCTGCANATHDYGAVTKRSCVSCRTRFTTDCCTACVAVRYSACQSCRKIPEQEKRQAMIEKFNNNSAYESPTTPFMPRKNTESCEDYSGVFLSHAQLYVLADKYDIKELRDLSAHKLWVTLKEFSLYPERMGDIIALVKYSFANTIAGDKLRTLLTDFCACTVEDLCQGEGFQDLICETPEFACELIKEMSKRLE